MESSLRRFQIGSKSDKKVRRTLVIRVIDEDSSLRILRETVRLGPVSQAPIELYKEEVERNERQEEDDKEEVTFRQKV